MCQESIFFYIRKAYDGRKTKFVFAHYFDTKDKAEELQRRIKYLNSLNREQRFIGGIICKFNGLWYLQNSEQYVYKSNTTDGWFLLQDII